MQFSNKTSSNCASVQCEIALNLNAKNKPGMQREKGFRPTGEENFSFETLSTA